jgi:hypothetical protein
MHEPLHQTQHADVNAVLYDFLANLQVIVGSHFMEFLLSQFHHSFITASIQLDLLDCRYQSQIQAVFMFEKQSNHESRTMCIPHSRQ